jgi:DNA-binding transcriptional regulator YhcF (GntR family)
MTEPPFARIVAAIRSRIESGALAPGERVPSTRQITREWGVAMATATKVLTTLRQEGLVVARPGIGTVVAAEQPRSRPQQVRTPTPDVTRHQVVRTAIAVADTEGASAVTMRRVAAELGLATMSLYRHVSGKDQLLTLMVDEVFGDHPFPAEQPPVWRDRLELVARLQWTIFRRHPWAAMAVSVTRPVPTPNTLAHAEWVMRALDDTGLDGYRMFQVHLALINYVRGMAVNLEWEAAAEDATGITNEQYLAEQDPLFEELSSTGAYPTFARVAMNAEFDLDLDEQFEFGLQHLLDGFVARLPVDAGPSAGPPG